MWDDYLPILRLIKNFDERLVHDRGVLPEDANRDTVAEQIRVTKIVVHEYKKDKDKVTEKINTINSILGGGIH